MFLFLKNNLFIRKVSESEWFPPIQIDRRARKELIIAYSASAFEMVDFEIPNRTAIVVGPHLLLRLG